MPARLLCLAVLLFLPAVALAQPVSRETADLVPVPGLLRNGVSNLHAEGDTLWAGPLLNVTTDGGESWLVSDADSIASTRNRVFSIDVEGSTVWVGLGYDFSEAGSNESVVTAGGFLVSRDGGRTFTYRPPQLDAATDTVEVYGANRIAALPIIVPQQSPPYDLDYDAARDEIWVAAWASGIRRSADGGRTWQRVVLPPDDLTAVDPDSSYDFVLAPQRGGQGNRNHMGFSVLVDEEGTIWAGTAAGVNRSTDGGVRWRRFQPTGAPNGLPGSWIVSIEEQPLPGRNAIWMATWSAGEGDRYGVGVTRDGGATFEQLLVGEQVIDFAFRGETVYVAGRASGLFISDDGGVSWRTVRDFRDAERPDRYVRLGVDVQSVARTSDALWVGTAEGLFRSTDEGRSWRIFRTTVPLHPETPTAEVPDVDTYAYPNPFSPAADGVVRIRYDRAAGGSVDVRIFDFGMNLVRRLTASDPAAGPQEVAWDGTDEAGLRVANGVYFYAVQAEGRSVWGKIQLLQ